MKFYRISICLFSLLFFLLGCDKVSNEPGKPYSKNIKSKAIKNVRGTNIHSPGNIESNISVVSLDISNVISGVNKFELLKILQKKLDGSKPLTDEEIRMLIENSKDIKKLMKKFEWNYDLMVAGDRKFYLRFLELAEPELTQKLGKFGYKEEIAGYYMKWSVEGKLTKIAEELKFPDLSDYPDEKTFRKELLHYSQIIIFAAGRARDPEIAAELYLKSSTDEYDTYLSTKVDAAEEYIKAYKKEKARELLEKVINTPKEKLDYIKPIAGEPVSIFSRARRKKRNENAIKKARKILKELNKTMKNNNWPGG